MDIHQLINFIRENHLNADALAQLASAVECMREELGDQFATAEPPEDNFTDGEADADALASAGWGMDEDYGAEDRFLDSYWESLTDIGGDNF
jgi:hypothetical protein